MRILLVEDDVVLRRAIAEDSQQWPTCLSAVAQGGPPEVLEASSATEGVALLDRRPDLALVDVRLPDGSGLRVVEKAAALEPAVPTLAMSGEASAEEAFALARLGVRGYVAKPFTLAELRRSLAEVLETPPELGADAAAQVGHRPIHVVQDAVRRVMLRHALARHAGNISRAAELLGVQRQAVQQMIVRFELQDWVRSLRRDA